MEEEVREAFVRMPVPLSVIEDELAAPPTSSVTESDVVVRAADDSEALAAPKLLDGNAVLATAEPFVDAVIVVE